jgi:diguanylate cyclase (GGDEF)-like protein
MTGRKGAKKQEFTHLSCRKSDENREWILSKNVIDYVIKESIGDVDYLVGLIRRCYYNRSIKVLVVDDSTISRRVIRQLLERQLFIVLEATSGLEALSQLEMHPDIKLVITDYLMPGMDGFELISQIRKAYLKENLAIIGVSAHGSGILSAKFIKKGANDFMSKPFLNEEFTCRISQNLDMLEYIGLVRDVSNRDYMTQLYNRRYFYEAGKALFENARRGNLELCVAMMDIDHFKQINDTYGHEMGDAAIRHVAAQITDNLRGTDIVSRFGGDEFCVLAAGLIKSKILTLFNRLRMKIEDSIYKDTNSNSTIKITVSIGISTVIGNTLEETVKRADEQLYRAKQIGRNQVVVE